MHSARARLVLTYIAANVRRIRTERGVTQERLAEASDVDLTFVQRIEAGKANPSVAILVAISDVLGVAPEVLFQPAMMPEIKRGRPRKARSAAPTLEAAPEPSAAAPVSAERRTGRKASTGAAAKASTPAKPRAPGKASAPEKPSTPGKASAGRKRSQ